MRKGQALKIIIILLIIINIFRIYRTVTEISTTKRSLLVLNTATNQLVPIEHRVTQARNNACGDNSTVKEWANDILKDFNIKGGLEELKMMAIELVTNKSTEVKRLNNIITNIHTRLAREYKKKRKESTTEKIHVVQKCTINVKSLAFIKAFKVGGTLISSLLSTYAYTYDLNIDSESWSVNKTVRRRFNSCVDIAGTQHPSHSYYSCISNLLPKIRF